MPFTILAFGQTADALQTDCLTLPDDTDATNVARLKQTLEELYPRLRQISYQIAVNQQLALPDDALPQHATIALLPPFSGG